MAAMGEAAGAAGGAGRLSALVVARDEEARIADCLASLRFADEIVVLLDRSRDRTGEIARAAGARIVEGAWELEADRRNAGIAACGGDWILEVDADERATPALGAEIRAALPAAPDGYFIVPMANHVGTHLVRHGWGAYNGVAAKPILFRKGTKRVLEGRVHPKIEITGTRAALHNPLVHFVDRDLSDMIARLNRYTDLAALDARDAGRKPQLGQAVRRFWKSYVARHGHREGAYGLALATFSALYPLLIFLKVATARDGSKKE